MRSISNTAVTVAGTGATGSAIAPGRAKAAVISSVGQDALITFDGTFPGATTGAHRIYAAQAPIYLPVGIGTTIGVISQSGSTGCSLCISWLGD